MSLILSRLARALGAALLLLGAAGCHAGYVVKSAWFQAELLASRQPLDRVMAREPLSERQRWALGVVAEARSFGEGLGFADTDNYGTLAVGWEREIWAVSACEPLAFEARTWWFPVVGRVPYLGFFRVEDAARVTDRLAARGYDVYKRTAGAYSTLGWFRDPILPSMLTWSEADLAETVLHELAHATVWIPGSVPFNESFASFVGEEAAFLYMDHKHGAGSEEAQKARADQRDYMAWRALQHALYRDLEAVYADSSRSDAEKLEARQALFAAFPERVRAGAFADPAPWVRAAERGPWNNARLIQFKAYNENRPAFEALLARHGGDLLAFMEDVKLRTRGRRDPFAAIEEAARAAPPDRDADVAPTGG